MPGIDQIIGDMTPLGYVAAPEDHAGAYLLLASEESKYITATIINSDGGIGIGKRPE